jgi:hypothetical protein
MSGLVNNPKVESLIWLTDFIKVGVSDGIDSIRSLVDCFFGSDVQAMPFNKIPNIFYLIPYILIVNNEL